MWMFYSAPSSDFRARYDLKSGKDSTQITVLLLYIIISKTVHAFVFRLFVEAETSQNLY